MCNGSTPLPKVIGTVVGSLPPLLTVLAEISCSSVVRAVAYNAKVPGFNPIGDIAFFGDKICSTVTRIVFYICSTCILYLYL